MANSFDLTKLSADEVLYLRAKATYYIGEPIIDDVEFDILEEHLRQQDSFVVDIVGQVKINKAGTKATISKGKKVFLPHKTPMGSLAKIQFKPGYVPHPEFIHWLTGNIPANTDPTLEFGPKLDGNAINITYDNGHLISVTSRGDGIEGQDYTKCYPNNIPKFIKGFTGEIRGEAVMDTYVFETTYGPDSNNTVKKYANARNIVASALTKGDAAMVADIDLVAFQIVGFDGDTNTQLIKWGFDTLSFLKEYKVSEMNLATFEKMYAEFKYYRDNCKYQLDGIVCKVEEQYREEIGRNNHHPFWALAIKFETKEVYTTIIGIEWTLGKRGQLAPVAILEAVDLLGSVVQRASVYNASWMLKNKCYPGAKVSLIKSGDIIPKIVDIVEESSEDFELPTEWNDHSVSFDGVQLMVDNFEDTDDFKALKLHSSIVALGIEGIGPSTATRLQNAGMDLITLLSTNPDGLRMELLKSGEFKDGRELEKLVENVFALTKVDFWKIIYAMGYRNCGRTISKQLANWMVKIPHDFKGLEKAVVESFVNSDTKQTDVKKLTGLLIHNNVNVIKPEPPKAGVITYEMSGDCSTHGTKKEFSREVEAGGKCIHTSLNKETNYLVVASTALSTGKTKKAERYGSKVVTYQEFIDIIKAL